MIYFQEEPEEDEEYFTAHNTMVQRCGGGGREREAEPSDGTITDLGTLVIVDDEEEEMDTMKSIFTSFLVAAIQCFLLL